MGNCYNASQEHSSLNVTRIKTFVTLIVVCHQKMIFSFETCRRMRGAHKVTKAIHEVKRTKKCDEEVGGGRRLLVVTLAAASQSFDVGYFISCAVINMGFVLIIIISGMIENMSITRLHHCKYHGYKL